MPSGGKRIGAGRKPTRYLGPDAAKVLLERLNWQDDLVRLYQNPGAKGAREQFAILSKLLEYAYGRPAQQKEPAKEGEAKAKVVVNFVAAAGEGKANEKPRQMGPANENVTVQDLDTPGSSSGPLGSSLGPSGSSDKVQ